jgi:uncharacterized protein (DUF1330 family)
MGYCDVRALPCGDDLETGLAATAPQAQDGEIDMPKGYWVAHLTITDAEMQKKYVAADKIAFDKYGGKYIVRGGPVPPGFPNASRCEIMQGTFKNRHVVIEFESYEQALACYRSPEYQHAITYRNQGCEVDILVIEGFEP